MVDLTVDEIPLGDKIDFFRNVCNQHKTNGIFAELYAGEAFLFLIVLFLEHLGQVTFSIAFHLWFVRIDTEEFSDIVLIYDKIGQGINRSYHCNEIKQSEKKRRLTFHIPYCKVKQVFLRWFPTLIGYQYFTIGSLVVYWMPAPEFGYKMIVSGPIHCNDSWK